MKAFTEEKTGEVQGSIVSPVPRDILHTPEEEDQYQKLLDRLRQDIMNDSTFNQMIDIDQFFEEHLGDFVQIVYNIINIYQTIGQILTAKNPLEINANTIKLKYDEGLHLDDDTLEVYLDSECKTGSEGAEGCGLEFNDDKLRVAPEDFLKTEE